MRMINHTPRASLTIALLDDEDYTELCKMRGGMEAFGLFCALVVAARERHSRGRTTRIDDTNSLMFVDSVNFLVGRIHATRLQLDRCLALFRRVSEATGAPPWLYLAGDQLVIRSFFKFNTRDGWGGRRAGSGRKPSANQDGIKLNSAGNQVETILQSSWCDSSSSSYLNSSSKNSNSHTPLGGARTGAHADADARTDADADAPASETPAPALAPGRDAADRAELDQAVATLCADLRTENVGLELGRRHQGRRERQVAGWQWRVAAEKLQGENVTPEQMCSFPYFAAIARNVSAAERHRPRPGARDPDAETRRDREAIMARYGGLDARPQP